MHKILLWSILVLGAVLYFYDLPENPPGFFCDEASDGYDAYCISRTLRDQHGAKLPVFLYALRDWRGGAFAYLCIPAVKLFGLNEASVRGTAAVIGILTILFTYLLARELAGKGAGLLAALFLTICPWHFFFSRVAFVSITFPLFFTASFYFFLRGIYGKQHGLCLSISGMLFSLTTYTYFSARLCAPLFVIALLVIYRKKLWRVKKAAALFLLALCVFGLPFANLLLFHREDALARFNAIHRGGKPEPSRVLATYLDSYSYRFLFKEGDAWTRSVVRGYGVLPGYSLPFIIIALILLIRRRNEIDKAFLVWLLIYPIPGSLTHEVSVLRNIMASPLYAILAGYGTYASFSYLRKTSRSQEMFISCLNRLAFNGLLLTYILLATYLSFGYLRHYFLEYPLYAWVDYAGWQFGAEEAFGYVKKVRNSYDEIIWNTYGMTINAPHILASFYMPGDAGCKIGALGLYDPSKQQLFIVHSSRLSSLTEGVYRIKKQIVAPDGAPVWTALEFIKSPLVKEEGKILVDNDDPGFSILSGRWSRCVAENCYGASVHVSRLPDGPGQARWTLAVPEDKRYEVFTRWIAAPGQATDALYTLHHSKGVSTVKVNQQENGMKWNSLGTYSFSKDKPAVITLSNNAHGWVIADAIKLEPRQRLSSSSD
jgi:4-amino-4-deoxy-L-arabinose transferase-like glycosyltransferase